MRHVCGPHCGGGFYNHTYTYAADYNAEHVYNAGRAALGGKIGGLSVCIYILLGLIGLPIFTQGGGIGYVFQPSFG